MAGKIGSLLQKAGEVGLRAGNWLAGTGVGARAIGFAVSHPTAMVAGAGAVGGYALSGGSLTGAALGAAGGYYGAKKRGWGTYSVGASGAGAGYRKAVRGLARGMKSLDLAPEGLEIMGRTSQRFKSVASKITSGYSPLDLGRSLQKSGIGTPMAISFGRKELAARVVGPGAGLLTGAGIGIGVGLGKRLLSGNKRMFTGRSPQPGGSYGGERTSSYGAVFSGMGNGPIGGY